MCLQWLKNLFGGTKQADKSVENITEQPSLEAVEEETEKRTPEGQGQ